NGECGSGNGPVAMDAAMLPLERTRQCPGTQWARQCPTQCDKGAAWGSRNAEGRLGFPGRPSRNVLKRRADGRLYAILRPARPARGALPGARIAEDEGSRRCFSMTKTQGIPRRLRALRLRGGGGNESDEHEEHRRVIEYDPQTSFATKKFGLRRKKCGPS